MAKRVGQTRAARSRPELMTATQLLALSHRFDHIRKWSELDRGVLKVGEPSGMRGPQVAARLITALVVHVVPNRLGEVFSDPAGYILTRDPDTVLAPDVSFVRQTRVPYGIALDAFFDGAPDLAVEVMSPSNSMPELRRKALIYLNAGASLVWIIRPQDRTGLVLRADGTTSIVPSNGSLDGEDVVPGFCCALMSLF
jgi:Uma2 family endonuclease